MIASIPTVSLGLAPTRPEAAARQAVVRLYFKNVEHYHIISMRDLYKAEQVRDGRMSIQVVRRHSLRETIPPSQEATRRSNSNRDRATSNPY